MTTNSLTCQVSRIEPLTKVVSRIILKPSEAMQYKPGQYLRVIMGEKDKRPFSIASEPSLTDELELHIGAGPDNQYAAEVLARMQSEGSIEVDGGHGKAYLREQERPTLLIAGGTGFSYTWSILQSLLKQKRHEPVFLYWGTRTLDDMYAFKQLNTLAVEHSQFSFVPVVESPPDSWQGKTGWVHKAVLDDFISLEPYQVYIAGRFEMAGAAREDFHNKGLLLDHLFGDAYEFI